MRRAATSVAQMSTAMRPMAAQKRSGESKNPGWKFIPRTPAMRVEGRITTEAVVTELPEKNKPAAGGDHHGPGGGMDY